MTNCPDWVFDIAVSKSAETFLSGTLSIEMLGDHYTKQINLCYAAMEPSLIAECAEALVRFLAEIDAGENAVDFLRGFCFFRLNFEIVKKKRNLKPLFGAADDGVDLDKIKRSEVVARFKAYTFGLRSQTVPTAPETWKLENEVGELSNLSKVFSTPPSLLDII